jgi:hypothetical protein
MRYFAGQCIATREWTILGTLNGNGQWNDLWIVATQSRVRNSTRSGIPPNYSILFSMRRPVKKKRQSHSKYLRIHIYKSSRSPQTWADEVGPDEEACLAPSAQEAGDLAACQRDGCCGGVDVVPVVPNTGPSSSSFPSVLTIFRPSSYRYELQSHRPKIRIS